MQRRALLCAAFVAALLVPGQARGDFAGASSRTVALTAHDGVHVYAQPNSRALTLAVLVQQSQVEVLGARGDWTQVRIWASVRGWIRGKDLVARKPWESASTYRAPPLRYKVHARAAQTVHVTALATAGTSMYSNNAGKPTGWLSAGTRVSVRAWKQDRNGKIWYETAGRWVDGTAVRFLTPDPGLQQADGKPLWSRVSGKGMWLTLGTMTDNAPDVLVRAAQKNGITHLYLESAISPLGFHGRDAVGPVLEAAHRKHLAVIAWVYPYLYDIGSDVALTREVAAYRSAGGQRFDGIAADLEQNVQLATIRAYSQLVRAYLGTHYLLVGVTYQPQSFPNYPFADVAAQYNAIAPMDYWHQTKTANGLDFGGLPYGYTYGFRYAQDSIKGIRRFSGHVPAVPIGQTFDNFGRMEMGPYAPSADEIGGFLAGSRAAGAPGVSFFQWMTATDAEWRAIQGYRF